MHVPLIESAPPLTKHGLCAVLTGDCREVMSRMLPGTINCVMTSPPYWGLRDYKLPPLQWADGTASAHGLEPTLELYVAHEVEIFREVRRVLRDDGTLWLNLGDSYASGGRGGNPTHASSTLQGSLASQEASMVRRSMAPPTGLKPKDLCGIPWRVAFALQADGWYLRQDIIWSKPNPMPESVRDRCTKAHEYLFLLSKSENYYFDQENFLEPVADSTRARLAQSTLEQQKGSARVPGKTNGPMKAVGRKSGNKTHKGVTEYESSDSEEHRTKAGLLKISEKAYGMRNRRSVWTVTTQPFKEAHFATFPPKLVQPCLLAGCPVGGTVLDPFAGSGTTGMVAAAQGKNAILIEANPDYVAMIERRLRDCKSNAEVVLDTTSVV